MSGPLSGLRIVEFAAIGPAPFAVMLMADLGAEVVRIDRPDPASTPRELVQRGRASVVIDLKAPEAAARCLDILDKADVVIEGFRPGVMERLGLGPEEACRRNPRLIYARMTGWGQTGPLARTAGHDINYIALAGALASLGEADKPFPPLNLVGDYGGGGLYLVMGVLSALYERERSGRGQVIDAAIVDGAASLMSVFFEPARAGLVSSERGRNVLGGSAPYYGVYACSDGRFVSIGPLEPQFYALLLEKLDLDENQLGPRFAPDAWPAARAVIAARIAQRSRAEWTALLEGTDVCFAPVLELDEVADHPHARARAMFGVRDGLTFPAPAPRFSRTPGATMFEPTLPGVGGDERLMAWGVVPSA